MQQIMDTLAMDILTNLNTDNKRVTSMIDTDNEFLQVSWHFDRATGKDVAKVCFVFDGAATIDPNATVYDHNVVMDKAVKACSKLVSDVAATFGSAAHVRSLRYLMWLTDKEITTDNDSAREAYSAARRKFNDVVMEVI